MVEEKIMAIFLPCVSFEITLELTSRSLVLLANVGTILYSAPVIIILGMVEKQTPKVKMDHTNSHIITRTQLSIHYPYTIISIKQFHYQVYVTIL